MPPAVGATPRTRSSRRPHQLGTDRPLPAQYAATGSAACSTGDFGDSCVNVAVGVGPEIASQAVGDGAADAGSHSCSRWSWRCRSASSPRYRSPSWTASAISVVCQLGIAVPAFWLGLLLVCVFAVRLRLAAGRSGFPPTAGRSPAGALRSLVLPCVDRRAGRGRGAAAVTSGRRRSTCCAQDHLRTARARASTPGALCAARPAQRRRAGGVGPRARSSPPCSSARSSSRASSRCPAWGRCCSSDVAQPLPGEGPGRSAASCTVAVLVDRLPRRRRPSA